MQRTNRLVESVISMSKLSHELPHSGLERFLDGLAVVALNGFSIDNVSVPEPSNEHTVN
jgi:hypothetical protein